MKRVFYLFMGIAFILVSIISCGKESFEMDGSQILQQDDGVFSKGTKEKVCVWHYDSETDTWKTLSISGNGKALQTHLNHGDTEVECPNIGLFLDSAVENLSYSTATQSGTTNEFGEFEYLDGETITFSIGDLEFPVVEGGEIITPMTMAGTTEVNNSTAINIARLLLTLDEDGDPDNGIQITSEAIAIATQVDFFVDTDTFENDPAVVNLITNSGAVNSTLISVVEATAHVTETINSNPVPDIVGAWEIDDSVIFLFLPDYRYFAIQWVEEYDNIGFERGTYTVEGAVVTFETLQNNDGQALICNEDVDVLCSGVSFELSVVGNELTANGEAVGTAIFDEDPFVSSSIVGAWEIGSDGSVIFMFLPDDRYFGLQWVEENNNIGFERGTYAFSGGEISINTEQNNDGDALVCGGTVEDTCTGVSFEISVTNNIFTAGETSFTRIY